MPVVTIFTVMTEMVTWVISALGELMTFIIAQPYILVPMLLFFISGGVVAILMRLWRS